MAKIKYIHRKEEFRGGKFWYVSIDIAPHKYVKTFSDANYGTKDDALQAAIEYRDTIMEDIGLLLVEDRKIYNNIKTTNSSGVNGVSKSGNYYHAYIQITPYQRKAAKFSISKYGEDLAFKRAVMWRKGMELVVYGQSKIADF